jgi:outer membrane protein
MTPSALFSRTTAALFLCFLAQSSPAQSLSLSLDEAMDLAADQAFGVRQAQLSRDLAASETIEIIRTGLPQVSGAIDYNNYLDLPTQVMSGNAFGLPPYLIDFLSDVSNETGVIINAPPADPNALTEFQFGAAQTLTAGVTVTQLIFSGSFLVGIQAAQAYANAMESSVEASVQTARKAAAEAYVAVAVGHAQTDLLEDLIQTVARASREARKLADEGLIDPIDADRAELQLSAVQAQMGAANMGLFVAEKVLAFALALPADQSVETTDDIHALQRKLAGVTSLATGFSAQQLPTIDAQTRNVELAQLGIKLEHAKGLPTIRSFYTNQRNAQRDAFDFLGDGAWYPIQMVGVNVSVPIWSSGAGKQKLAQARIQHQRADLALEQMTLAATLEHHGSMSAYISALDQKQQAEHSFTLATRILDQTGTKFTEGIASSTEFSQATSAALGAQSDYIQAVLGSLNAYFRVLHANGK